MIIAFAHDSGTIGKTTLAANLAVPRIPNAKVFAVESNNQTMESLGIPVKKYSGAQYIQLYKDLASEKDAIVDFGASNLEAALKTVAKMDADDIDYWIIPVTPIKKVQDETVDTVNVLNDLGIPSDKIRLLFNQVENDVQSEFGAILNWAKKEKLCVASPEAAVFKHEVFDLLVKENSSIDKVLADPTNYRAELKNMNKEDDPKKYARYRDMAALVALAKSAKVNLDQAWNALF